MNVSRGDICLARMPHAAGGRGKKRPVVVIQSDAYNAHRRHAVVAEITSNLTPDAANLPIDISTTDGQATGLKQNSAVTCLHLVTMSEDRLGTRIGRLSAAHLALLNECLKAALDVV